MTIFKYGSYSHPQDEVKLVRMDAIPRYERGSRLEIDYIQYLEGELIYEGTTLLDAIQNLITVYGVNNQDAILCLNDGTETSHALRQNHPDNISGVGVVRRSWDGRGADELATVRTFSIILSATYRRPEIEITSYTETIRHIGSGGPMWALNPRSVGLWTQQFTTTTSPQQLIQQGSVIGYDGWPLPRIPPPIVPAFEQTWRRQVTPWNPQFRGRLFTHYRMDYTYFHLVPAPNSYLPTVQ